MYWNFNDRTHILIVEDEPVKPLRIQNLLDPEWAGTTTVLNGQSALRELRKAWKWDLVILDFMLPDISGLEICRRLRELHSLFELPVLMLTASGRNEDAVAAFSAGANDFLAKPFHSSELQARVRTLLHMKQSVVKRIHTELAFLQAQLKPHFLFNTLNSIASLSESDLERMKELVAEFGSYLRESFSFNNLEPLTSMQRELQLVRSYLHIEKTRFGDRLKVHYDVPEYLPYRIPPLTLQPIVETSIRQGILKRIEGGEIGIRIQVEPYDVIVQVWDNGAGLTQEQWTSLLSCDIEGVGLKNINRRLKQMFGSGMLILQKAGEGATVEIRMPKMPVG
ncbi:response regulator [Paenibacillus rigui]|uniref:histidine kinase n=1 Tax=Paenibacillus rigui TaxID=554312 RepID=A0A229UY69_9BACL|nr:response regulator [Paenibacillus rigui]OXM88394.1 hypothetical protein CF651_00610 [Paenibacillus rigui]